MQHPAAHVGAARIDVGVVTAGHVVHVPRRELARRCRALLVTRDHVHEAEQDRVAVRPLQVHQRLGPIRVEDAVVASVREVRVVDGTDAGVARHEPVGERAVDVLPALRRGFRLLHQGVRRLARFGSRRVPQRLVVARLHVAHRARVSHLSGGAAAVVVAGLGQGRG